MANTIDYSDAAVTQSDRVECADVADNKKKIRIWRIFVLIFIILLAIASAAAGMAHVKYKEIMETYSATLLPGTIINGFDCSMKTTDQAKQLMADKVEEYSITIEFQNGEKATIDGSDIDFSYKDDGTIDKIKAAQDPVRWVLAGKPKADYTVGEAFSFDKDLLREKLYNIKYMKSENMVPPADAYIKYENGVFSVADEVKGSTIDTQRVYDTLVEDVSGRVQELSVTELDAYKRPDVYGNDKTLNDTAKRYNTYLEADVTYTIGSAERNLNRDTIITWFTADQNGHYEWSESNCEAGIWAFLREMGNSFDTVGRDITFKATSGRSVTINSGGYGWELDESAMYQPVYDAIHTGDVWVREVSYVQTARSHDGDTLGGTYIEVDLAAQHMYYYQGGSVIFESDIVSGLPSDPKKATPPGLFFLDYKKLDHVMIGENHEYETPCKFWMPFNGGVGFHDATWQDSFGGDWYKENGSHGCINLPYDAAEQLYGIITSDVPILVFN